MKKAKVFKCGNSQAVRLPKEFQFQCHEVEIFKRNDELIIREKPINLAHAFELLTDLPDDFFQEERKDDVPQAREGF